MSDTSTQPDPRSAIVREITQISIPSLPDWISPTIQMLCEKAISSGVCDEQRVARIRIAMIEALTNSVVHGNLGISSELKTQGDAFARELARCSADESLSSRPVDISVDFDGNECKWTFADHGSGFNVQKIFAPPSTPDPTSDDEFNLEAILPSGRGIMMMRSFMDDVFYQDDGRKCIMVVRKSTQNEKREFIRRPCESPVRIVPVGSDGSPNWEQAGSGVVRDLSKGGMAVIQAALHGVSRVLLEVNHEGQTFHVPADVCREQAVSGELVELGCKFVDTFEGDESDQEPPCDQQTLRRSEIPSLIKDLASQHPVRSDRRAYERIAYSAHIQIQQDDEQPLVDAFCRNLSKSGIAFISGVRLDTQEIEVVLLPGRPEELKMRALIVRCNRISDGVYDIGARFVSDNQLSQST